MYRFLITHFAHVAARAAGMTSSCRGTRPFGRPLGVLGLAALAALMLGTLSGPAAAQIRDHGTTGGTTGTADPGGNPQGTDGISTPLRCYLTRIYCEDESNDNTFPNPDHDEIYAVIFAADLRGATAKGA